MRQPLLTEIAAITVISFGASILLGAAVSFLFKGGLTVTYLLSVLTVGPALAIYRGMNRQKDLLTITERAMAELIAIAVLLAVGGLLGRHLG
jgi:hypothetical protein